MDIKEYEKYHDYEEVKINGKIVKFYIISIFDIPLELVSTNFEYYALWIRNEEDGQLWFLVKLNDEKVLEDYFNGKECLGEVFKSGEVKIVKRYYESYNKLQETNYKPSDYVFPDYDIKLRRK